jgi:hypothetical protein
MTFDRKCFRCVDLEGKLGMHSALIQDLHPNLQQIWQEQLDRVRRQQIIICFIIRLMIRNLPD